MTWYHDTLDAAVDYGPGHCVCQSCQQPRATTDMARVYVDDEFFLLCHGVTDERPTCWEKYQAGRKRYGRNMRGRRHGE